MAVVILPPEVQVVQRVDQQRRPLGGDQTGVPPAPAAIRPQLREQAVPQLMQPFW